jgi:hypothetical protein
MIVSHFCKVIAIVIVIVANAASAAPDHPNGRARMAHHVKGSFDVKLHPLDAYNTDDGAGIARMSIDKRFHGALDATSKGEMVSAAGSFKGSAGYVAIERVTGTLDGRSGSFTLQHNATMTRGAPSLNIIVVPDSGTGELAGLSGKMNIVITNGAHFYEFEYVLETGDGSW